MAAADHGRTTPGAGKLPNAGAARILVGPDVGIDHTRPAARYGSTHRFAELGRTIDADARDAGRARHGGKVGIVRRAGFRVLEVCRELAPAEIAALQSADRCIGVVVPHDPHDWNIVLDRGAEHARMHEERAVANHRNAWSLGRRQLGAENAGNAKAHWAEPHRPNQRVRTFRPVVLQQPVVMYADVADQNTVVWHNLVDLIGG